MIDHLIIEHKENQIILCDELDRDTQLYYYNKWYYVKKKDS